MPAAVESMMYTGATPWHGLGVHIEEAPTSEDAIRLAGLDWEVEPRPLFTPGDRGFSAVPEHFANVRSSDGKVLGVVGRKYSIVQNRDAFSFCDSIASGPDGSGDVRYETAGSLIDGRKVWMLARLLDLEYEVVPGDPMRSYLLLANWHNGGGSLIGKLVDTRVVCANTLAVALGEAGREIKIRHVGDVRSKIEDAQEILGLARLRVSEQQEIYRHLAGRNFTGSDLAEFASRLYPYPVDDDAIDDLAPATRTRIDNRRGDVERLFETATGNDLPGVRGTAWAAVNAVTYLTNHERTVRGRVGDESSRRLDSVWFGTSATLNDEAFRIATSMAA